jgi:hypothetical protein
VLINYRHRLTGFLGSLPYSFVTPSNTVLFHTSASVAGARPTIQPVPEYSLGVP